MGKSKRRILAGIMSLLMIFTSVFTGDVISTRAEEGQTSGTIQVNIEGSGQVTIDFYEENGSSCFSGEGMPPSHVELTSSGSVTIPSGEHGARTVKILALGTEGYSCKSMDATGFATQPSRDSVLSQEGATVSISSSDTCTLSFVFETGSHQSTVQGDINISIVNGQNGHTQYKIGGDGSWQDIGGSGFSLRKSNELEGITNGTKIYFKATPNLEQSLDTHEWQNKWNDGTDHDISVSDLTSGDFYIAYDDQKAYSVQIKYNEGSQTQTANNGDIQITIGNDQNAQELQYKVNEDVEWHSFSGNTYTLRAGNELNGVANGAKVYMKAVPKAGCSLDSHDLQCRYRYDSDVQIPIADLQNGTFYITYDNTKSCSVQIQFEGGSQGPGGTNEDRSFDPSCMGGNDNQIATFQYKVGETAWTAYTGNELKSLHEGDSFAIRMTMKDGYTVDKLSLHYEPFSGGSRVDYKQDTKSESERISELLSDSGYTITFRPEADSTTAGGNSTLDDESTRLRVQYQISKTYAQQVKVNLFFQTKDFEKGYGVRRDVDNQDSFVDGVGDGEVMFAFNDNQFGDNGDPVQLGYGKYNTSDSKISVTYKSQFTGNTDVSKTDIPEKYDFFSVGGYTSGETKNILSIKDYDNLYDEVYIIANGTDFSSASPVSATEVTEGEMTYHCYNAELTPADSYSILIRKHLSNRTSLKWSYNCDQSEDYYVDHGKIFINQVKRGDTVLLAGLSVSADGTPSYTTNTFGSDYSFDASAGEIFLEVGDQVTIQLIPDYGYQIKEAKLNGFIVLTPNEEISTFTFINNGNLHLAGNFIKTEDAFDIQATEVRGCEIQNGDHATESGNLSLKIEDNSTYGKKEEAKSLAGEGAETLETLDMTLQNKVSKGNGAYWTNDITSFDNPISVDLSLSDQYEPGDTYIVVREHNGQLDKLEATYTDGKLSIPTNQFSTYSILKISARDEKTVESIAVTTPPTKTNYTYGESLDTTGIVVTATYSDGSTSPVTDDVTYEGSIIPANATVTVKYGTKETSYTITVSKATPTLTLSNLSETTQNPTGVRVSLSPADASAIVKIEYEVVTTPARAEQPCKYADGHLEDCAAQAGNEEDCNCGYTISHSHDSSCGYAEAVEEVKEWTTVRPTAPGTYPVRANLPSGTDCLNAVTSFVTGTYTLTSYHSPAPSEPEKPSVPEKTQEEIAIEKTIEEQKAAVEADLKEEILPIDMSNSEAAKDLPSTVMIAIQSTINSVIAAMPVYNRGAAPVVETMDISSMRTDKGFSNAMVKSAEQFEKSNCDVGAVYTGGWVFMNKDTAKAWEKCDIDIVWIFEHKGHTYKVTIPKGTDLSNLLDKDGFAGPLYIGNMLGTSEMVQ